MGEPTTSLADHLKWMESIGSKPCICNYGWRKEKDYLPGWVRLDTDKACLEHGRKVTR